MTQETTKTVQALKAHLALNVRDVERSIEFYRKMLGIEPSKVRTGYAKFDMQNPPLNLSLNQVVFKEGGALSHLGIQVASTDDVLATRDRWAQAGLVACDEMQTNCCYALQDKTWVHDPDGNQWEVFVVLQDNLPEKPAELPMCCGTGATEQKAEVLSATTDTTAAEAASCCAPAAATVEASACCESSAAPVGISR